MFLVRYKKGGYPETGCPLFYIEAPRCKLLEIFEHIELYLFLILTLFRFNVPAVPHWIAVKICLNHKRDMCKGVFIIYKCKGQLLNRQLVEDVWVHTKMDEDKKLYVTLFRNLKLRMLRKCRVEMF